MRILHTSDWHLGQHFMGKTRLAEHTALIDWLLQRVDEDAVDALILAGDIFDTGAPPSYARELYNRLVVALHGRGVSLLALGGNHDSVATLAESLPLLACLGAQVVPVAEADPARQVRVLNDRSGQPGAIVCAVPFIRARDVMQSRAGESAEAKQQSLQAAIAAYYQSVYQAALARRDVLGLALPILATGHLTTVGASASEAVREIYVGALEAFPTRAFPPADYIALGHIHRPQQVGGQSHIRYCGAPIPLGFDEARQRKEVLYVDLDAGGLRAVTPVPVPCWQPMAALSGTLAGLEDAIAAVAVEGCAETPVWLDVQVQADDYLSDLMARVQALAAPWPVEVLRVRRARQGEAALPVGVRETLDELTPLEVFARRLADASIDPALHSELEARYRIVLDSLREGSA